MAAGDVVNAFYQQWGLISASLAVSGVLSGFVLWLVRIDKDSYEKEFRAIQENIASLFKSIATEIALNLIRQIDKKIPVILSQADDPQKSRSRFDMLCENLMNFDDVHTPQEEEGYSVTEREKLKFILQNTLSDILIGTCTNELEVFEANQKSLPGWSVSADTELGFRFLAKHSVITRKKLKACRRYHEWATNLFIASIVLAISIIPWLFINYKWANYGAYVSLGMFVFLVFASFFALARFNSSKSWIQNTSLRTEQEWQQKYYSEREHDNDV